MEIVEWREPASEWAVLGPAGAVGGCPPPTCPAAELPLAVAVADSITVR